MPPSSAQLITDIRATQARLAESFGLLAARLDPGEVAWRAQHAVARRLGRLVREAPLAAAVVPLGLSLALNGGRRRGLARAALLGAASVAWGALLAAVLPPQAQHRLLTSMTNRRGESDDA